MIYQTQQKWDICIYNIDFNEKRKDCVVHTIQYVKLVSWLCIISDQV